MVVFFAFFFVFDFEALSVLFLAFLFDAETCWLAAFSVALDFSVVADVAGAVVVRSDEPYTLRCGTLGVISLAVVVCSAGAAGTMVTVDSCFGAGAGT